MAMNEGAQLFLDEARELLGELEELLLELELNPENMDQVARVFRTMHTIKGSGAMFGFEEVARFTHEVETVFDRVRSGEMKVDTELLGLALKARDHIFSLLESPPQGDETCRQVSNLLMEEFRKAAGAVDHAQDSTPESAPVSGGPCRGSIPKDAATWWVRFRPKHDAFAVGTRPLSLIQELVELGRSRTRFEARNIPELDAYDAEAVYGWWDVLLCTDQGEDPIRDVFVFLDADDGEAEIRRVANKCVRETDLDLFIEFLAKRWDQSSQVVGLELEALVQETIAPRRAAKVQEVEAEGPVQSKSIRVDSHRLDMLVNMVGELVIIQSRLTQAARGGVDESVVGQISEDLERLTDEMRDNALSLRMLPIGTMMGGLRRLVRDLSVQLGKKVRLATKGEDTELDKTVIDQLKDPLMHALRNCLDHAIEPPEVRRGRGKDETGLVILGAEHASGEVVITVADDGGGLDLDAIHEKAVAKGLIEPGTDLSPREIANLIFLPGFSTAKQVSDVSGRGVGMDVVKRGIEALRGKVDLDTKPGLGTTLTIRLPLTLAIIDGLNVVVGGESFIMPLTTVEACEERFVNGSGVRTVDIVTRRGHLVPCVSLRRLLGVPGEQPGYERVIICSHDGVEVGFGVDRVIGRQQAVIKPLSDYYHDLRWISGTTINGDGGISLILDIPQLVGFARENFDESMLEFGAGGGVS
ncbi:MAG: chemotaxis protein CheA [Deltaproteobacteria bacterium]|nr:chemotaxis protein CheA [Deltaproteobacteria bacterium]